MRGMCVSLLVLALAFGQSVLAQRPAGDSFASATPLTGRAIVAVSGTTRGFPSSIVSTCNAGVEDDGPDRFYSYTAPMAGILTAKACGFSGAVVTVYARHPSGFAPRPVACGTCSKPARLIVQNAGTKYFFVVSGSKASSSGAFNMRVVITIPGRAAGSSMQNPIQLGSGIRVRRAIDSSTFADIRLGDCNDPNQYASPNTGDGPDVFFRWTAPRAGVVNAAACSSVFGAQMTVLGNGTDADGEAVVNGVLSCGGTFNDCNDPLLNDPDSQLLMDVTEGQSLLFSVTGTEAMDYGLVQLNIDLFLPGSSFSTSTYLDPRSGSFGTDEDTTGYPNTLTSSCNQGDDGPDRYYGFYTEKAGTVTVQACSDSFEPTVTVLLEASVAGGSPSQRGCGTCSEPAVVAVSARKFYYIVVSGNGPSAAGPFSLTATMA